MSASVDNEPAAEGEDAREVLAGWLEDYIGGRCQRSAMQASFLAVCRSNPDAPWDALALLDQYQRRGRIDQALARALKTDIAQLVFGIANQTESPQQQAPSGLDTSSRWRQLLAASSPQSLEPEPAFIDPALSQRDCEAVTRPRASFSSRQQAREPSGRSSEVLRDRYELVCVLGRGSTGTVYQAVDRHRSYLPAAARSVAIKVLKFNEHQRPGALAQLQAEFHQASSLTHPNIARVVDLDRDGDTLFIVMELLEGEPLSQLLPRLGGRPLERGQALGILAGVGAALAHAHSRGVVHADLKPGNIMITRNGEVRVLNFGLARNRALQYHSEPFVDGAKPQLAYASRERLNGSEPHPSDDVYSFACIAYELLCGQHPFGGRSAALSRAHGRPARRIPGLNARQSRLLRRALQCSRDERKVELVELLAGLGCAGTYERRVVPEQLVAAADTQRSRRWALLALTIVAVVALAAPTVWYLDSQLASTLRTAAPGPPRVVQAAAVSETQLQVTHEKPDAAVRQEAPPPASLPPDSKPRVAAALAPAPAVEFDKDTYVVNESDGTVRLTVLRSGSVGPAVQFRWSLRGNSAAAGSDYASIGPVVESIDAGAGQASITIPLVSDAVAENTEVFLVEIEPVEAGVTLGQRSHVAVIIVDDD